MHDKEMQDKLDAPASGRYVYIYHTVHYARCEAFQLVDVFELH